MPLRLFLLMLLLAVPAAAQERGPLAPLDTSSPRATYLAFEATSQAMQDAYVAYRADKRGVGAGQMEILTNDLRRLFDLSEVPPAQYNEIGGASAVYLTDILLRLPVIDPLSIPGEGDELPPHWRIPGTEIVIAQISEGERSGEYLFSPRTVERLPEFHARIIDLPPQRETAYLNWREEQVRFTGPLFAYGLSAQLPQVLQRHLLGTPRWKVLLSGLVWLGVIVTTLFWARWAGQRSRAAEAAGHRVRPLIWRLTTPLLLKLLITGPHAYIDLNVNLSGAAAAADDLLASFLLFAAAAWTAWLGVALVIETIIASPAIPEDSYDANLLRLIGRVSEPFAAGAVLVYGAADLGIPALGLFAGVGVGGFALALAAQSTVENLFGGVSIFADRPFRVGDFIAYGTETGVVEQIGPRSSRLRGLDGTLTTVPNADLAKIHVVNYSVRNKCLFLHTLGLRYETTPGQLEWIVHEVRHRIGAHPMVEESPGMPRVRVMGFGASSIDVEVRAHVLTGNYSEFLEVQEALLLDLMRIIEQGGSGFAFPSQTVYVGRDGGLDEAAQQRTEIAARRLRPELEEHPDAEEGPSR